MIPSTPLKLYTPNFSQESSLDLTGFNLYNLAWFPLKCTFHLQKCICFYLHSHAHHSSLGRWTTMQRAAFSDQSNKYTAFVSI